MDFFPDFRKRMDASIETLTREFTGLRTGRASIHLLDPIRVEAYGAMTPLSQIATVSVPEPRLISVQVWDKSLAKQVEKAIRDSSLGLNPSSDGQLIRIALPPLTEERRQEITRIAAKYSEEARVSIRNVRREAMDRIKKQEKASEISEDEQHRLAAEVQSITDEYIKKVDELLAAKQKDILSI